MKSALRPAALLALGLSAMPLQARDIMDADRDHDGRITRAEFAATRSARFGKLDRNHDGVVSEADIGAVAWFRPDAAKKMRAFIKLADANGDGRVTPQELARAPMPAFDKADANHDGVLAGAEIAALGKRLDQAGGGL